MQTTITEVGPTERTLTVEAPAEDLEGEVRQALQAQRKHASMKGFRQGKVPLSLVKKMYGQAIGMQVAEKFVQEAYEQEVAEKGELDVLGQPEMTELDYALEGDLRAVIRFAVRPEIELKDLSDEEIPKLAHAVTDEEVEEEIEKLRLRHADVMPTEDPAGEESYVTFDLQEIDAETGAPVIGKRDEDQSLFLDSPQLDQNPMLAELKKALLGTKPGDTVRFTFAHDKAHEGHPEGEEHAHRFEATVHEVKRRELPDLDDAFVKEITEDGFEDVESFRAEVRSRLEEAWEQRSRELLQGKIVERMLRLHPVPVPDAVVEMYLDSFVEDVKERNEGELPEGFDEAHFRARNRGEAEQQAHWMLVRDKVAQDAEIEITDADRQAFFERQAERSGRLSAEQLRQFYQSMPQMMSQVEQQVLSRKVFDALAERFNVVEKSKEAFEEKVEREEAARQAVNPVG